MLRQSDSFKSRFDLLVMISAAYNCFSIPFKVAFDPKVMQTLGFEIFDVCIDLIFLCDMILTFRLTYIDDYGNEEVSPLKIAVNYLKGQFWLDLFATIPIDSIIQAIVEAPNQYYGLFGILKLGRVLRLNKIISFLNVTADVKASMKLTKMILFLLLYTHLFACCWRMAVKHDRIWEPPIHQAKGEFQRVYASHTSY